MAANFDIIVKAVDQTKGTFNSIERSLNSINGLAAKVGGAIAGAFSVKAVLDAAVAYQSLEKRIIAVTGAGAASSKTLSELNTLADSLGVSVTDLGLAFNNLKSVGLDSSAASLKTYAGIAAATGRTVEDIADAIGNAYQGSFGKISKATNDLIEVENKYGQFVVTIGGKIQGQVATTGQVVGLIKKYAQENQNYTDALKKQSESISASYARLGNATTKAFASSGLDKEIAAFIDRFIKLEQETGAITNTFKYLGEGLKFVSDNFKLIGSAIAAVGLVAIGGRLVALGKAAYDVALGFNKWISAVASGKAALVGFSTAAGKNMGYATAAIKTVGNAWSFVTSIFARTMGTYGTVIGTVAGVGLSLGVFGSTLLKLGGLVLRFLGGPWGLLISGVLLFSDEIMKAGRGLLEFFGILDKKAEFKVTVGTPTGAGYRSGPNMAQATAGDGVQVATGLISEGDGKKANSFLDDLFGNFGKLKTELSMLQSAMKKTTDINLLSKMFDEASSRAEQLGIVLQKPSNILRRDFSLSLEKVSEELRITKEELKLTDLQALKFSNEMMAAANSTTEAKLKFQDLGYQIFMFNNELENSQINLDIQQFRLSQTAQMATKFAQELQATNIELATNAMRLADAGSMSKKFAQEITATQQSIAETALRLGDAQYQQGLFNNNIEASRQVIAQNTITFGKLNEAYAQGTISSLEYATALRSIDESLLNVTQKTILLNEEYSKIVKNSGDSSAILANLTAQYQTGAISLEEYAKKLSMVSYEYENLSSVTAKAMKGANDEIRTEDLSTEAAKNLTAQLRAGTISWRQYNSAISKLDSTGVQKSFINIESEILRVKTLGEALSDTLNESTKKAGAALADNLTSGIMKGQLRLSSFKDFFGSILNDITAMLIKKQFVSPIVDALTGAMGSGGGMGGGLLSSLIGGGGGGSSGGGLGSIFSGISDWFGGFFATGGYLPGGKLGIAGEAGPELISGPANITPMDSASGATPIVNFTINAIDTQTGVEFLMKNKPQIIGMVQQGFNSQGQRGIYA